MSKQVSAVFPYRSDPHGEVYPIIPFSVTALNMKRDFYALIDSGATISVFKAEVAEELGIEIEKGQETYLGGVGGRIKGYIHFLKMEIAGKVFRAPVVFSREYLVSFNLLGRDSFFPKFRITFEEKKQQVELH